MAIIDQQPLPQHSPGMTVIVDESIMRATDLRRPVATLNSLRTNPARLQLSQGVDQS